MGNYIDEIKNYILFLKRECNLQITLHPVGGESLISMSELIMFNIHENPHCIYVKTFPDAHRHCVERQNKIIEKCKNGSFCGVCYAGVKEYVYPISDGKSNVGFVCISGYRTECFMSYIKRCSEMFNIPLESLENSILPLHCEMPEKQYVDTLIMPLLRMLELAYGKSVKNLGNSELINEILKYVNKNYTQDITLEQPSTEYSCSRSYISHNFKKAVGMSFREYLTHIRLCSAELLLLNSKLTVTEISESLGFCNSNYFSGIFKMRFGVSPRTYRSKNR